MASAAKNWWDRVRLPAHSWAIRAPPALRSCFAHLFEERGQNSVKLALLRSIELALKQM